MRRLQDRLAAAAAGSHDRGAGKEAVGTHMSAGNGDPGNPVQAERRLGSREGGYLPADAEAVAGILHVRPGDDLAVHRFDGAADAETRIGGIGAESGVAGPGDESGGGRIDGGHATPIGAMRLAREEPEAIDCVGRIIQYGLMTRPPAEILPPTPGDRAFRRLHALVRKGYVAELGRDAGDGTIRLTHIARTPDLILHGDGSVEEVKDRVARHKRRLPVLAPIPANADADEVRFMQFVDAVPRPTLRDRTRRWRTKWVYGPLFLVALWLLSLLFTGILLDSL